MRAKDDVYHVHCFTCASCGIRLAKGDHFGVRDGLIYCRPHYETLKHRDYFGPVELEPLSPGAFWQNGYATNGFTSINTITTTLKGRPRKRKCEEFRCEDGPTDLSKMKISSVVAGTPCKHYVYFVQYQNLNPIDKALWKITSDARYRLVSLKTDIFLFIQQFGGETSGRRCQKYVRKVQ